MKREYTSLSRRKCSVCKERLEYNTCWPQNIEYSREGWGYYYCSNNICRYRMVPRTLDDVALGSDCPTGLDSYIDWGAVA